MITMSMIAIAILFPGEVGGRFDFLYTSARVLVCQIRSARLVNGTVATVQLITTFAPVFQPRTFCSLWSFVTWWGRKLQKFTMIRL